jgi:hypothetical protein
MNGSKYEFLNGEIIDNFFISDSELAEKFIDKYGLDNKRKDLENYIFKHKAKSSLLSILNSKIKKLLFDDVKINLIRLSTRYYKKFIQEYQSTKNYNPLHEPHIDFNSIIINVEENPDNKKAPVQFLFVHKTKQDVIKNKNYVNYEKMKQQNNITKSKKDNILIIGDLHLPFSNDNYFSFCKKIRDKYNATKIIFIGDLIDNHYSSFYPSDPDGYSAGEELFRAKDMIKEWYNEFPNAVVLIGNHDRRISLKAIDSGISRHWIKSIAEVLETPTWYFTNEYIYQDVCFEHGSGTGGNNAAYDKSLYKGKSVVCGHFHTISAISYINQNQFGMVVGCGISSDKYAFNYALGHKKPVIISCGIITSDGTPILETMR